MRAIYTQWTAPVETSPIINDKYSGFPDFETFLWSWVCSVTLARKNFDRVELYCDTPAKQILIDQLQLPFDEVHITLDNKEQYRNIWAYGKMDTYMRQTEPFVHLDADLFLYKKLDKELEYPYFFWTEECEVSQNGVYIHGYDAISNLPYVPKALLDNPVQGSNHLVVNVGLFSVQNPNCEAYQEYATELHKFFEQNKQAINQANPKDHGGSSVVIEQYLIYLLLKKYNIEYGTYGKLDENFPYEGKGRKCLHFVGPSKLSKGLNIKQRAIMLTGKKYIKIVNDFVNL
jgi:hypothetical protein